MKPIGYEGLSGIVVFPVRQHGIDKAFGDLPELFAREYSAALSLKAGPETKIYNPAYTVDMIRLKGLGNIYDKMMSYYTRAGKPDPRAADYLLKQIADQDKPISRIVFVETDLDMSSPEASTGLFERLSAAMTDSVPKGLKGMVHSRIQVFDASKAEMPRIWAGSWQRAVKLENVRNMTPSVFSDSDSEMVFASVSRRISQELFYVMPRESYMVPVYDNSVRGRLAEPTDTTPNDNAIPSLSAPMSNENRQNIQRILDH